MDNRDLKKNNQFFRALSLGLGLGFLIVAPLVGFLLSGLFLDGKFNTTPIFLISLVILSLIVSFVEVRLLILPFLEKRSQTKK